MHRLAVLCVATVGMALAAGAIAAPERVEFPADYKDSYTRYFGAERANGEQYAVGWANQTALEGARAGLPLPAGSKFVMEVYKPKMGMEGEPVRDAEGQLTQGDLAAIAVMEKQEGWGEAYPEDLRTGDWDFAIFTPAGELKSNDATECLQCHVPMSETDYLHSSDRLIGHAGR